MGPGSLVCQLRDLSRAEKYLWPLWIIYRFSQGKSEALFNIYSLLKQNIKSCNAKKNGEDKENGKKQQEV